jgi:pyruvate/2-oxoacid:ferredoxin oxidoreductase beta subunit
MTGFAEKSFWAKSSIPDPKLALQVEGVATVHISTPCGITWEYPLTKVI